MTSRSKRRRKFNGINALVFAVLLFLVANSCTSLYKTWTGTRGKGSTRQVHPIIVDKLNVNLEGLETPSRKNSSHATQKHPKTSEGDGKPTSTSDQQRGSQRSTTRIAELQNSLFGQRKARSKKVSHDRRGSTSRVNENERDAESTLSSCDVTTCGLYGQCINNTLCSCLATHSGSRCSQPLIACSS